MLEEEIMIYVMSDIHGCYEEYIEMLKKIMFSENDTLYILGDVVDRGPQGIKVLLDIAERKNVKLLKGNHDQEAAILLENIYQLFQDAPPRELVDLYKMWLADGGSTTMKEFLEYPSEQQKKALKVLKDALLITEIIVNSECYILAHSVPSFESKDKHPNWEEEEILLGEPDYEKEYFDDKYIITGHTPTGFIEKDSVGRIWQKNRHIAIDCGVVFGKTLGCLCLDSMEEYYV